MHFQHTNVKFSRASMPPNPPSFRSSWWAPSLKNTFHAPWMKVGFVTKFQQHGQVWVQWSLCIASLYDDWPASYIRRLADTLQSSDHRMPGTIAHAPHLLLNLVSLSLLGVARTPPSAVISLTSCTSGANDSSPSKRPDGSLLGKQRTHQRTNTATWSRYD